MPVVLSGRTVENARNAMLVPEISPPACKGIPLASTTSAVIVHITIVSAKTSKIPYIPCFTGSFVFAQA